MFKRALFVSEYIYQIGNSAFYFSDVYIFLSSWFNYCNQLYFLNKITETALLASNPCNSYSKLKAVKNQLNPI